MTREFALKLIDNTSLLASIVVIAMAQWLGGVWSGFAYGGGYLCEYVYPTFKMGEATYTNTHGDPYPALEILIADFSLSIFIFSLSKLYKNGLMLRIAALIPMGVGTLFVYWIWSAITQELNESDKYVDALRETFGIFHIVLVITTFIWILQVVAIVVSIYRNKRPDSA